MKKLPTTNISITINLITGLISILAAHIRYSITFTSAAVSLTPALLGVLSTLLSTQNRTLSKACYWMTIFGAALISAATLIYIQASSDMATLILLLPWVIQVVCWLCLVALASIIRLKG